MAITKDEVEVRIGSDEYIELVVQKLPRYVTNGGSGLKDLCQKSTKKAPVRGVHLEVLVELMGRDIGLRCTMATVGSSSLHASQYSVNVAQSNTMCSMTTEADNLVWISKIGGGLAGYSSITAIPEEKKKEDKSETEEESEKAAQSEKAQQSDKGEQSEKEKECAK